MLRFDTTDKLDWNAMERFFVIFKAHLGPAPTYIIKCTFISSHEISGWNFRMLIFENDHGVISL